MEALHRCSKCKEHKPAEEMARNKNYPSGIDCWCRRCHREASRKWSAANGEKKREATRAYRERNPEKVAQWKTTRHNRRINLKAKWDMTPEQYDELLAAQGGVCAVCREHRVHQKFHNLHIDHDHETGVVRGLLCGMCNKGIGALGDSPERLEAAATYLRTAAIDPTPYRLRQDHTDRRRQLKH